MDGLACILFQMEAFNPDIDGLADIAIRINRQDFNFALTDNGEFEL